MKAAPGPPPPVPPTWAEIMADIANAPDTDVAFAQAPEDTPTDMSEGEERKRSVLRLARELHTATEQLSTVSSAANQSSQGLEQSLGGLGALLRQVRAKLTPD